LKIILSIALVACALFAPAEGFAATLSAQTITETGGAVTYANSDTGSGDKTKNMDGLVFLHIKNPGASSATVTINAIVESKSVPGYGTLTKSDRVISLTAGQDKFVGPFPPGIWTDSTGFLNWTYGGASAADVDVAVLKINY
jgi:hypothetical protein